MLSELGLDGNEDLSELEMNGREGRHRMRALSGHWGQVVLAEVGTEAC